MLAGGEILEAAPVGGPGDDFDLAAIEGDGGDVFYAAQVEEVVGGLGDGDLALVGGGAGEGGVAEGGPVGEGVDFDGAGGAVDEGVGEVAVAELAGEGTVEVGDFFEAAAGARCSDGDDVEGGVGAGVQGGGDVCL